MTTYENWRDDEPDSGDVFTLLGGGGVWVGAPDEGNTYHFICEKGNNLRRNILVRTYVPDENIVLSCKSFTSYT